MKKILITLFLFFNMFFLPADENVKSLDLKFDESFGSKTDWIDIIPRGLKSVTQIKDTIFITALRGNHQVYQLDKNGNLIKKIGQKGEGPGDFYRPGDLSILDNKYLIISEYASKRRISVFDLNGKFVKIIKTKSSVFSPLALKNNKIAFYTMDETNKDKMFYSNIVKILDIKTNKVIEITKFKRKNRFKHIAINVIESDLFLCKTVDNNLAVGCSENDNITIFNEQGEKLHSFKLNMKREKLTKKIKNNIYQDLLKLCKQNNYDNYYLKMDWKNNVLFPDYFPCYSYIGTNNRGEFLVVKAGYKTSANYYKIFSPKGVYLYDMKINYDEDKYILKNPPIYLGDDIFFCVQIKDDEDELYQLMKIKK